MSCTSTNREITDAFGNRWNLNTLYRDNQLPKGKWSKIASDQFGFLWVGGKSGLIRFDPRQPEKGWTNFIKDNHYPGGEVKSMEISQGGLLWVGLDTDDVFEVDIDYQGKQTTVKNPQIKNPETCWKALAPMPYGVHDIYGALFDGKIYIPGGGATHGFPAEKTNFDKMMIYDIRQNLWKLTSPMKINRRYCNVGLLDGKIWVVGGFTEKNKIESPTNSVEIYDPLTNRWVDAPPLAYPCAEVVAGIINERLYVAYSNHERNENFMQSIAPGEKNWRTEVAPPYPIYQTDGCVYENSFFIMIPAVGLISFDTSSGTWKSDHKKYPGRQAPRAAALTTFKNEIWVISGTDIENEQNVRTYNPKEKQWKEKEPLPHPTLWADALEADGKLYLLGGASFSQKHNIFVFWNTIRVYCGQN